MLIFQSAWKGSIVYVQVVAGQIYPTTSLGNAHKLIEIRNVMQRSIKVRANFLLCT